MSAPRTSSGAGHVLKISAEGPQFRLRLLRGEELLADALWSMSTDGFFTKLEAANS
jgi:hypothetical protein